MTIDLTQFHDSFFEESFEAITTMEDALLKLTTGSPDPEVVNTIFRVAHSIKGGAATFGFNEVASFTHTLETLLDELRGQRMLVTQDLCDLLLRSVDVMRDMLRATQAKQPLDAQKIADLQFDLEVMVAKKPAPPVADTVVAAPASSPVVAAVAAPKVAAEPAATAAAWLISFKPYLQLLARGNDPLRMFGELAQLGELEVTAHTAALPPLAEMDPENCYVSWQLRLVSDAPREAVAQAFDWAEGDCELSIEREVGAKPETAVAVAEAATPVADAGVVASRVPASAVDAQAPSTPAVVKAVESQKAPASDSTSIRVSTEKIDELMNTVGELVITQSMLTQLAGSLHGPMGERLRTGLTQLERSVRELQEAVMRVRMVPISFVFSRFPRMVRDLSQRLGKQIELKMTGGDTELDKTVLEKIGDPLVHLVRNGIDHGIERPDVRVAAGKPEMGTLHLHAYHRGGNITVEVSEDGGGINTAKVLSKAKAKGLVAEDAELTDAQIHDLLFLPGFSTADQATDVSGRGVGMDVVRRNIEELGGSVEVRSELGKGSRFIINLPLTLAIVDGQTIQVSGESYIVPLTAILESLQVKPGLVQRVVGHGEVFSFRGDYLPVLRLNEFFSRHGRGDGKAIESGLIMIVEAEGRRVGLCVDELLGQQQVVVKTLETNYQRVDGVAGATILGDGSVALILDVAGLARRFVERAAA
jgi:two-component system chemotaxis sensor kinase CheA